MNAMCNAFQSAFKLVPLATFAIEETPNGYYEVDSVLLSKRICAVASVVFASCLATCVALAVASPIFFPLAVGTLAVSALALPILYFDYSLAEDATQFYNLGKAEEAVNPVAEGLSGTSQALRGVETTMRTLGEALEKEREPA
ncbi:MAG: hypothetical protein K0S07_301 [Chlamydiales bacterium]|jgi:hypothetical protein|nr:hypothetical protein [Chlamydiales bacterium]